MKRFACALVLLLLMASIADVGSQSVVEVFSVPSGLRALAVFTRDGYWYLLGVNVSTSPYTVLVYNLNTSELVRSFQCDVVYTVAGAEDAYVACGNTVVEALSGNTVVSYITTPSYLVYDFYSGKLIGYVYGGVGSEVYVDGSSYWFSNWWIYGISFDRDYYYLLMFNQVSWWLAKYTKDFSRVVANVSIPVPSASRAETAYSGMVANELGVVVLFDNYTLCLIRTSTLLRTYPRAS
jgi:hypothetical protein